MQDDCHAFLIFDVPMRKPGNLNRKGAKYPKKCKVMAIETTLVE